MAKRRLDPAQRIIEASLALAARQGWRAISLADIAREAGLPVLDVYRTYRSKSAILAAFLHRVDAAVLAGSEDDTGERARDRLFDTIMRRFDALAPYKAAIRHLARESATDPVLGLTSLPSLLHSMRWMLEASGVSTSGWRGALRVKTLAALYLSVLRLWLDDESPDMIKTMAALDRRLRAAENWLGLAGRADDKQPAGAAV
jgi:AcrR family transcriptional regulator